VLSDVYKELSDLEREQARGHLFAGIAVSEYLEEYKRGDFLVRNIIGADPKSGAVAINAVPRVGQTLQYQLRDSRVASDELKRLLREQIMRAQPQPYAGLLCTCHGRGRGLFGGPNHDAGLVNDFYPGLPMAGFSPMCNWAGGGAQFCTRFHGVAGVNRAASGGKTCACLEFKLLRIRLLCCLA